MQNKYILSAIVTSVLLLSSCGNRKESTLTTSVVEETSTANVDAVDSTISETEMVIENSTSEPLDENEYSYGTVKDYSTKTSDCGFVIEMTKEDGSISVLEPFILDDRFKNDGLKIKFSYTPSKRPTKCTVTNTPININTIAVL